jgi:hypothetical protein
MIHRMITAHRIEYIDHPASLAAMLERLSNVPVIALDLETIDWWKRTEERISIIQLGFREEAGITVAILDLLSPLDPEPLRAPLEWGLQVKAIHNASYDAVRLARHYGIQTSPVHDTMLAARRSGEKRNSLRDLSLRHLGLDLEKAEQRSDWRQRPLTESQLRYAALDAVCTLLLYEQQVAAGLVGTYHLPPSIERPAPLTLSSPLDVDASDLADALCQIIAAFPDRYTPLQLAITVVDQRSGMVGWILDRHAIPPLSPPGAPAEERRLREAELRTIIEALCREGRLVLHDTGRLNPPTPIL